MEVQGVQDHSTDNLYEDPLSVQFNAYENVQVRDYANDTKWFLSTVNQGTARSQKHEQETDSNGKMSRVKTVLLVVCFIVAIACTVATIVLFTKVMNNEELHTQLNSLSKDFNITIEKVRTMIIHAEELNKKSLKRQQDMIQDVEKRVDLKLNEVGVRLDDTKNETRYELRGLEEKVGMKLSEVSARLNDTDNSISKLRRLIPVENCTQTSINGVYTLTSGGWVYCWDGWTVFQRRMDGSIPDFHNKTWEEYSRGFGSLIGEYWLGLRKLHEITRQGGCRLRVDLQSFDNDTAYAEYSQFSVANEANLFRLTVGGYSGTAGDSMSSHNGMAFSTNESDNDKRSSSNCAALYHSGGWWNNSCFYSAPNGIYGKTRPGGQATRWYHWKGSDPMKFIQMGVRCD